MHDRGPRAAGAGPRVSASARQRVSGRSGGCAGGRSGRGRSCAAAASSGAGRPGRGNGGWDGRSLVTSVLVRLTVARRGHAELFFRGVDFTLVADVARSGGGGSRGLPDAEFGLAS